MKKDPSPMKKALIEEQDRLVKDLGSLETNLLGVLTKNTMSALESQIMSEQVSQIRAMLTAWEELEREVPRTPSLAATIRQLQEKFLEIEGMAKERRNDWLQNG